MARLGMTTGPTTTGCIYHQTLDVLLHFAPRNDSTLSKRSSCCCSHYLRRSRSCTYPSGIDGLRRTTTRRTRWHGGVAASTTTQALNPRPLSPGSRYWALNCEP